MDFGVITALLFNLNDRYTPSLRERRTKGYWVQHGHGTRHKENIRSQQWLWFYISLIMTLYYKTRQILLQNVTTILLKNATKVYTKMRQFFLSQNATVSLQNPIFITKCLGTETKHCFFIWVFFHKHSRFAGQQGKDEAISLTPLYHFHLLHIHLDITGVITAESSSLHVAGSRTWTEKLDTLIHGHGCIDYIECNFTDSFDTFNTEKDSADTDNESDNEEVLSKNKQTKN